MKQEPPNSKHDRDVALACAEAYLRLAEPVLIRIKDVEESKEPGSFSSSLADSVAGATNLAFAIELYIKAILIVSNIDVSHDHNLGTLYAKMPQHFRVVIEGLYEEKRKKDWNGRYDSITLSKGSVSAGTPKWDDNRSESFDLEVLLKRSSDIFTRWRYMFEFKKPDEGEWQFYRLEYCLLLSACWAMRDTIKLCSRD